MRCCPVFPPSPSDSSSSEVSFTILCFPFFFSDIAGCLRTLFFFEGGGSISPSEGSSFTVLGGLLASAKCLLRNSFCL